MLTTRAYGQLRRESRVVGNHFQQLGLRIQPAANHHQVGRTNTGQDEAHDDGASPCWQARESRATASGAGPRRFVGYLLT